MSIDKVTELYTILQHLKKCILKRMFSSRLFKSDQIWTLVDDWRLTQVHFINLFNSFMAKAVLKTIQVF